MSLSFPTLLQHYQMVGKSVTTCVISTHLDLLDHHYVVNLKKNLLYSISSRKSMTVSELPDVSFHNASLHPHLINLKSVKEVIINIFHI